MSNYADILYNDLKKAVAERSLKPESLSRENLIAALEADDAAGVSSTPATEGTSSPQTPPTPTEAPVIDPRVEQQLVKKADREWKNDRDKMRDQLARQPKVGVFIPFQEGENPEQGAMIPFVVNLNGYRMEIPRGRMVDVPKQVFEVIRERLESEGRLGREHLISADKGREDALL